MKLIATLALAFTGLVAQAQTSWKLDRSHSNLRFTVTHMVVSEMDGKFKQFDGTIQSKSDDFQDAQVNFTVDVNSIDTDNENRDKHLKADDFFNVEKFPQMTFTGTSFKKKSGNQYELTGDLTVRGITKKVKWDVTYGGKLKTSRGTKAGFKATTVINRMDFDLKWNRLTEAGGAVVGKDVTVSMNLEFDQQQ